MKNFILNVLVVFFGIILGALGLVAIDKAAYAYKNKHDKNNEDKKDLEL